MFKSEDHALWNISSKGLVKYCLNQASQFLDENDALYG